MINNSQGNQPGAIRRETPEEEERREAFDRMEAQQREQQNLDNMFALDSALPATDGIAGLVGAVEDDRRRRTRNPDDGLTL